MNIIDGNFKSVLQDLYGLKSPALVEKIDRGYMAENFIIEDGVVKFFVKKYHPKRTPERLLEIHRVKNFFNKNGVSTIPPLVNLEGVTLSKADGVFFSVFPYVSDKQYYVLPSDKATASAGENLAKLHLAGANNLSLVTGKTFKPWDKADFLKIATNMLKLADAGTTSFDKTAREMLKFKIDLTEKSTVSCEDLGLKNNSILHGDYHFHNLFFDEQDKVSYTFDFERTMIGPRATDVAYGIFMICFDLNTETEDDVSEIHFRRARSFIHSYNKTFPIDVEEFLNGIRWYFWSKMVYMEWPFNVHYFEKDTRSDGLLPKRFNRLKYFAENLDTTLDTLQGYLSQSHSN